MTPFLFAFLLAGWHSMPSHTDAGFRGLSVVSNQVVWVSGNDGTILRTIDGGAHWQRLTIPDSTALDFRDIEAFDENTAIVLSSGPGPKSNVYRTIDGGAHWQLALNNPDTNGFFDALAFINRDHGFLVGDPVNGRFVLYETKDAGRTWLRLKTAPAALKGEGLFAASGTCLVASHRTGVLWFATGGGAVARVLHSSDSGRTWTAASTAIQAAAKSAGIFSLALANDGTLAAVGGDFSHPDETANTAALSRDGGASFANLHPASGYRFGICFQPKKDGVMFAVGRNGSDVSIDAGKSWREFSKIDLNVVAAAPNGDIWAAGPHGAIVRLPFPPAF